MFSNNKNKALPILNISEVQEKFFVFNDNEDLRKFDDFQSKLDIGNYKDPEIHISDEYIHKYFMDENEIIIFLNPIYPNYNSCKVVK